MKKIIFSTIVFIGIANLASAQTTSNSRNSSTKRVSTSALKAKKFPAKKRSSTKTVELDNRKEYMKDGQLATPTGHEAAPVNGEQFQSVRDSSNKKKKKQ